MLFSILRESREQKRVCVDKKLIQRTRKGGGKAEQTGCGQSQTDLSVREHRQILNESHCIGE